MIIEPQPNNWFDTEERCAILELLNNSEINDNISIAKAQVEPGVCTALHKLDGLEIYYILQGEGQVEIQGIRGHVKLGDIVYINPGQTQRIKNTGHNKLIFLCICCPRFRPESYVLLE